MVNSYGGIVVKRFDLPILLSLRLFFISSKTSQEKGVSRKGCILLFRVNIL